MSIIAIIGYILISAVLLLLIRITFVLFRIYTSDCALVQSRPLRTIICIGSGGHTTELLGIIGTLNISKYNPRLYILADNDRSSEVKIHDTERAQKTYRLVRIPRSRNVQQSYQSSVVTTLQATTYTVPIIYNYKPNIIFCNGPGTCVPVCFVVFLMRCLFLLDCRIVFIESICRVRTLSLTGKILQFFADVFIVQWPELRDTCFRAKYCGRLN